jgi:HlyD family secretion protein
MEEQMKRRWILIVVLLVLVLAAGGGYAYYRLVLTATQAQAQPTLQTTQVTQGDIVISADGTGNLLPAAEVDIGFETSGLLKTLEVKVGDHVTAGRVLGTLDTRDLELELQKAQLTLEQAQISLDKLNVGPTDANVTTARISVAEANTNLAQEQVSLSAATERARLSWVTSANSLRDAQASYSDIYWTNRSLETKFGAENVPASNYESEATAKRAVENAEAAMEQARLSYEATKKQEETSMQTARYQLTTAQTNLNALYVGATATDLASAQASLQQAQISYQQAQINLDKAVLKAPMTGTVMSVSAVVGTQVGTTAIITLADMDAPLLEFWVEEANMAAVVVGNKVNVTFEALPDLVFTGTVTQVDPALVTVSNTPAVQAWAKLDLAAHKERLLSGMAAQVEVVQAEARNVLLVPLEALRTLADNQYAVFVIGANGEQELRPVEVGLQDLVNAEIRSGLQAGEVVSLGQATSSTSTQTTNSTQTNPGGFVPGMGGFDGGGPPGP